MGEALERLEAAADMVALTNVDARQLLADYGVADPTMPSTWMDEDEDDDADRRCVPTGRDAVAARSDAARSEHSDFF